MFNFLCRRYSGSRSARARRFRLFIPLSLPAALLLCGGLASPLRAQTATPVLVPTWRYDITHSGANTHETALAPDNVNPSTFGKLFSLTVDGSVYAQPLYMSGLTMSDGQKHNVLFVATEHDSIYAFDADSNGGVNRNPIWHVTLLDAAHGAGAGATTVPWGDTGSPDIAPEIGITATPVINPATNTMYVVGKTKESGAYFQRLHAINVITGAELPGSPVGIHATVSGTGNGSSGGQLAFSPLWQNNRTALSLYNGHLYMAFGAHGDNGPWHGWVLAYDANTLAQTAAVCTSANGFGNGVWQAGSGMPIDTTSGRMFLATGNGSYSSYSPFSANSQFGDSIVAFDLSNGKLTPVDAFTPFNQGHLSSADLDQGSGGILMLPDQQGANPHMLMQIGKEGRILVLNRDHLGGYATGVTSNTNALQDIVNQTNGLWSTPAYWNGNVYMWPKDDVPKLFKVNSGLMDTTPSSVSNINSGYPGASFVISSDGAQNGVAWAVRTDQFTTHGAQVLYAWDANDLSSPLYESDTDAARDGGGHAMKFAMPVVTNGRVYVAANGEVDVYGLFNEAPFAGTPVISPNGGPFGGILNVTLTSATPSAAIYYTLDGTVPTPASTLYTGPIAIHSDLTIRAIAGGDGFIQSAVSSASFTSLGQTPPVSFAPGAGTYTAAQQVVLSDTDASAAIHYTTDGSTPTASSPLYKGPIAVSASVTLNAVAIDPILQSSTVVAAPYVIQAGGSSINFGNGFASVAGLSLNGSATNADDVRLQLTTGGNYQAGSVFWNQPIGIQSFTTDFLFQLSSAQGDGFTFTLQNVGPKALGASGSGLGSQNIGKSVAIKFDFYSNAGEGTDSTGVYTNGAAPTVPAVDMTSSGVSLQSGDSITAHVVYDGTTLTMTLRDLVTNKTFVLTRAINIPQIVGANNAYVGFTGSTGGLSASQKILYWTYATQAPPTNPVTAAPVFAPSAGSYSTPPSVTLTSATPGAVIYYTTNGTAPTTSSFVYTSPIVPGTGTTTIEAMALASGASQSGTATATYVVTAPITAAPTFSPAAGTYTSGQSVTLTDSTPGAVIHYTTNGTTPTTASAVYAAAIAVSASETIKAIAVAPSMQPSATATATYTIQTTGSSINFPSGFNSAAGLSLKGTAKVTNNLLQLTSAAATTYTNAAAWFTTPVTITTFTTDFDFQLLSAKADGFTFAIQNVGTSALGPVGSGLGYGAGVPGGTGGIAKSVAVKFDLYSNNGEGTDSTGVYTNGASPTIPATDMTASGVKLNSGHVLHAHITYDGTNLTLLLTDTTTSASFTKTVGVNIPSAVGGNTAYLGFTGGTGGLSMTSNILNWTMSTGIVRAATIQPVLAKPGIAIEAPAGASSNSWNASGSGVAGMSGALLEQGVAGEPAPGGVQPSQSAGEPKFFPEPGIFRGDTEVNLRCDTPGCAIHYTFDGSQPVAGSPIYGAPISVKGTELTIKAFASVPGKKDSAVVTGIYRIRE
jgi:hypothetical protein